MKKAILTALLATALPVVAHAQQYAPEPYRFDVIRDYCANSITPLTASLIEEKYYLISGWRRLVIRTSYTAVITTGDIIRHEGYCSNLAEAAEEIRRKP